MRTTTLWSSPVTASGESWWPRILPYEGNLNNILIFETIELPLADQHQSYPVYQVELPVVWWLLYQTWRYISNHFTGFTVYGLMVSFTRISSNVWAFNHLNVWKSLTFGTLYAKSCFFSAFWFDTLDDLCLHLCRNVLSSQEVVDFITERIKPDQSGQARPLSSIVEEVRREMLELRPDLKDQNNFFRYHNSR